MGLVWQKLLAPEPASSGYSCTITVGSYFDVYYGYYAEVMGNIDQEPIPGETLVVCWWKTNEISVAFSEDRVSLLNSLNVWLGGVNYGGAGDWTYDSENNITAVTITSGLANEDGTMLLELK